MAICLLFSACSYQINFNEINELNSVSINSQITPKADWFVQLSPKLQQYYQSAKGKTGNELFKEIHKIISRNTRSQTYENARILIFSSMDNIKVGEQQGLWEYYSQILIPGKGGDGHKYKEKGDINGDGTPDDVINCEHTWPQSFFNKKQPMVSDMHHLFPVFSVPNNRRSDRSFGYSYPKIIYTTQSGSRLSIKPKREGFSPDLPEDFSAELPEEIEAAYDFIFEPSDKQKGNTARALFYFYTRYHNESIRQGDFDKKDFWLSRVDSFIKWAEVTDPVTDFEKIRNDKIEIIQGNRNPFVDIPNLATLISPGVLKTK